MFSDLLLPIYNLLNNIVNNLISKLRLYKSHKICGHRQNQVCIWINHQTEIDFNNKGVSGERSRRKHAVETDVRECIEPNKLSRLMTGAAQWGRALRDAGQQAYSQQSNQRDAFNELLMFSGGKPEQNITDHVGHDVGWKKREHENPL
jgi:hypothetical protein